MVEFAFVIYLKQMQECKNNAKRDGSKRKNSEKTCSYDIDEVFNGFPNVKLGKRKIGVVQETNDQESKTLTFWSQNCALLDSLHLTNKIDLVGFVLFCVCYMIFNVVYWARVD